MKKDRMRELLTELREKNFDLDEVCSLFCDIDDYLYNARCWRDSCGTDGEEAERFYLDAAKRELKYKLSEMGLDYTLDEFITYD